MILEKIGRFTHSNSSQYEARKCVRACAKCYTGVTKSSAAQCNYKIVRIVLYLFEDSNDETYGMSNLILYLLTANYG